MSTTYQVVNPRSAIPGDRFRRLGQTLGFWDEDFNFPGACRQIFRRFDFRGKKVLEIGCGRGFFCLWAALQGAEEVIGLEPHPGHDTAEHQKDFQAMADELALPQAKIAYCPIQEYNGAENAFDLILSVSSINSLDERNCIRLRESPLAVMAYERIFRRVSRMMKPGGKLIIMDAAQHNFFGDLGFRNPLAPYTEWFKHQQPQYWADLLENCGLGRTRIHWTSGKFLRDLRIPYIPKSWAYFGQSMFRLEMTRIR